MVPLILGNPHVAGPRYFRPMPLCVTSLNAVYAKRRKKNQCAMIRQRALPMRDGSRSVEASGEVLLTWAESFEGRV